MFVQSENGKTNIIGLIIFLCFVLIFSVYGLINNDVVESEKIFLTPCGQCTSVNIYYSLNGVLIPEEWVRAFEVIVTPMYNCTFPESDFDKYPYLFAYLSTANFTRVNHVKNGCLLRSTNFFYIENGYSAPILYSNPQLTTLGVVVEIFYLVFVCINAAVSLSGIVFLVSVLKS